jgi:hypothetical protein
MPPACPTAWAGAITLAAPALGALIYGVPEPEGIGRTTLRAIGARDAALAG